MSHTFANGSLSAGLEAEKYKCGLEYERMCARLSKVVIRRSARTCLRLRVSINAPRSCQEADGITAAVTTTPRKTPPMKSNSLETSSNRDTTDFKPSILTLYRQKRLKMVFPRWLTGRWFISQTIFVLVHLIGFLITFNTKWTNAASSGGINKQYLKILADEILSMMDTNIDPCRNFHEFVCGNTPLNYNRDRQIAEKTQRELRKVFADGQNSVGELKPLIYAKNFYSACVNSDSAKTPDWSSLKEILRMFGGWPVVEDDSWSKKNFSWRELQTNLSKIGLEGFFTINYMDNTDIESVSVEPVTSIFSYDKLEGRLNNAKIVNYCKKIVNFAVKMGANRTKAQKDIQKVLEFDQNLSQLSSSLDKNTLKNLTETLKITESDIMTFWPLHFDSKNSTIFYNFTKLREFTNFLDDTATSVIFNHALMRLVAKITALVNNPVKRQEECINFVAAVMPEIQEILYVRKYLDKTTIQQFENLISTFMVGLTEQFSDYLSWSISSVGNFQPLMFAVSYYNLIISSIYQNFTMGNLDEFYNDEKIQDYYKDMIEIENKNFLKGFLNYTEFKLNQFISHDTFDFRDNLKHYARPSEKISRNSNTIRVPTGYLRTLFAKSLPKYIIYGDLLVKLGLKHNECNPGFLCQPVKLAYSMYKNFLKNNEEYLLLPGLENYSNEQMFWISLAHFHYDQIDLSSFKSADFKRDFQCDDDDESNYLMQPYLDFFPTLFT